MTMDTNVDETKTTFWPALVLVKLNVDLERLRLSSTTKDVVRFLDLAELEVCRLISDVMWCHRVKTSHHG